MAYASKPRGGIFEEKSGEAYRNQVFVIIAAAKCHLGVMARVTMSPEGARSSTLMSEQAVGWAGRRWYVYAARKSKAPVMAFVPTGFVLR